MLLRVSLLLVATPFFAAAQGRDVIRGRVTDREKHPLAEAVVVLSTEAFEELRTVRTGKDGRFTLVITDPHEAYVISVRQVGFATVSKVVRRVGLAGTVDVGDVALALRLDVLEPVRVRSIVLVPSRTGPPALGAAEFDAKGAGDFVVDPSDLAGLLSRLPGSQSGADGGFSVLGADPSQNRMIVDGADFGGSRIPRDAIQQVKLVTNTFDPSQGRFSGGAATITTKRGGPRFESHLRSYVQHPSLTWSDPRATISDPMRWSISGFASGPLRREKLTAFVAVDASRRSTSISSLLSPTPQALDDLGLTLDSIDAVSGVLQSLGIATGRRTERAAVTQGSANARADWQRAATTSFALSTVVNWQFAPRMGRGITTYPSTGSDFRSTFGNIQLQGSTYLKGRVLDEFQLAIASSNSRSGPLVSLPAGEVQVTTLLDGQRSGWTSLRFGGSGTGTVRRTEKTAFLNHSASLVSSDGRHQVKFTQEAILRIQSVVDSSNFFGAYTFLSVDDLRANRPAAYSRTLSVRQRKARDLNLAVSLGDSWRALPGRLELQGGVRFDATLFGVHPGFNPRADSAFGLRTDRVASQAGVSPRIGFLWRPGGSPSTPLVPSGTTTLGAQGARGFLIPFDAAGMGVATDADFTISGGIGAFRGTVPLQRVVSLLDETGLPSGRRDLSCAADATPIPNWQSQAGALPTACVGGASAFATDNPNVAVLGSRFETPVSWRLNFAVDGVRVIGLAIRPQFTYSVGRHVESRIERNLATSPAFVNQAEANRPVFAPMSEIDQRTGLIGPAAGRVAPELGSVTESVSDLDYRAAQLIVGVVPLRPLPGGGRMFLAYSWSPQSFHSRGFDGSTAGDPRTLERVTGARSVHELQVGAANVGTSWLRLATRVTLASGSAFTPMIAQDVNGDGRPNDRAFVVNPSLTAEEPLASQMRSLLANGNASVRRCLSQQLNMIAGANSCRTGWRARVDLAVNAMPSGGFGFGNRVRATLNVINANSALVRLFGLENTPLGRGSASHFTDRRLLYVTGFDSASQQFRYQVNQQFGEPRVSAGVERLPPFELQLGVQVSLGRSVPVFQLPGQSAAGVGGGSDEQIRDELLRRSRGPDRVVEVVAALDSLGVDEAQRQAILSVAQAYLVERNSILAPVVQFVRARGQKLTRSELQTRTRKISRPLAQLEKSRRERALSFLSAEQRKAFKRIPPR